jgi:hypothetical protein
MNFSLISRQAQNCSEKKEKPTFYERVLRTMYRVQGGWRGGEGVRSD